MRFASFSGWAARTVRLSTTASARLTPGVAWSRVAAEGGEHVAGGEWPAWLFVTNHFSAE